MITADILKTEVLKYWFFRRYRQGATEVDTGIEIADILVSNDREIIETEIKLTWSDFLRDFTTKRKHEQVEYLGANKFYFCVPESIKDRVLLHIKAYHPEYGLFSYNGCLTLIKPGKKIKDLEDYEIKRIKKAAIKRATSELIQLRGGYA